MRERAPAWSAFDMRMMFQGYLERGFTAEAGDLVALERLLGHPPRRYEDLCTRDRPKMGNVDAPGRVSGRRIYSKGKLMNTHSITSGPVGPIPADNPSRNLTVAQPGIEASLPHIGLVGDTYTILLSGDDTDGRYCLIDMHIPPGGGPAPHRHDFEESFTATGRRDRCDVPRSKANDPRRRNRQHSCKRAAFLYQRLASPGAAAVHLRTGGTGKVLRRSRCPGGVPNRQASRTG